VKPKFVHISYIGNKVRRFFERIAKIKDLFEFISKFGKQPYPVLEENDLKIVKKEDTNLEIWGLTFEYDNGTKVFDDHGLTLIRQVGQKTIFMELSVRWG